jgi:hypothetical protein
MSLSPIASGVDKLPLLARIIDRLQCEVGRLADMSSSLASIEDKTFGFRQPSTVPDCAGAPVQDGFEGAYDALSAEVRVRLSDLDGRLNDLNNRL